MKTVRPGSTGDDVAAWQRVLNVGDRPSTWTNVRKQVRSWGDRAWPLGVDGIFGPDTAAATESWQALHQIEPDGIVGPRTWAAAGIESSEPAPLIYGCDLSAVQGVIGPETWKALYAMGVEFSWMRSVVGNDAGTDAVFRKNEAGAKDVGIATGRYFFGYPLRHIDPRLLVDEWARKVESVGDELGMLPNALDGEWPPREEWKTNPDGSKFLAYPWRDKYKIDANFIRDWNCAALERGRELSGSRWTFYSFRYFLDCIEAAKAPELARSPLWLADYKYKGRFPTPAQVAALPVPAPWSEIVVVQFDGDGGLTLPGGRDADFNVMTGGRARLNALTGREDVPTDRPKDLLLSQQRIMDELLEADVARYRRERIQAAEDAAA